MDSSTTAFPRIRTLFAAATALAPLLGGPPAGAQDPPPAPAGGSAPETPAPDEPEAPAASPRSAPVLRALDRRLRELEAVVDEQKDTLRTLEQERAGPDRPAGGILSLNNAWLQLGGLLRLEYVDVENEPRSAADRTEDPSGRFRFNRFRLTPRVTLRKDLQLEAEIDATGAARDGPTEPQVYAKQAWVTIRDFPLEPVWIEAGLRRRFIKPARKTETFPLAGEAFWRDDDLGLTTGGEAGPVYWRAGLYNGLRLDDGPVTKDDSFFTVRDERANRDGSGRKEVAAGLGAVHDFGSWGAFDLLGFGYLDRLSHEEILFLRAIPTYGTSDAAAQHRFGAGLQWTLGDAGVFAQAIRAADGGLRRTGWYVQPSYRLSLPAWLRASAVTLLYRYDGMDLNLDAAAADSRTWDRRRSTVAALVEVTPDMTVKAEYNVNNESTGGNQIDNDELIMQLEVAF